MFIQLQSSIVPLYQLVVREKGDTRADSNGIYLITPDKKSPEMYEIVCNSAQDRQNWIAVLRSASDKCPEDGKFKRLKCVCVFLSERCKCTDYAFVKPCDSVVSEARWDAKFAYLLLAL